MSKKETGKDKEEVEKQVLELLEKMGFPGIKIALDQKDGEIQITVDSEDRGILIGYHGEVLSALQLILSLIFYRKTGKWQKIHLDVGNYWQKRGVYLEKMAQDVASRVGETGKTETLPYLSARERRIIHEFLAANEKVATESVGEGRERRLIISPK